MTPPFSGRANSGRAGEVLTTDGAYTKQQADFRPPARGVSRSPYWCPVFDFPQVIA
jgi:hypothetical protein